MLNFEHIQYLWGALIFIPVVLLFVLTLRWKRRVRAGMGDAHLIEALTKNYSHRRYHLKFWVVAIALLLSILAYANMRIAVAKQEEQRAGIDVMIALDVSKSMWAQDVKPSRLEQSKALVNGLIEQLEDNRIGIVVFAGKAYLQMPLTTDKTSAKMFLDDASPYNITTQGTNVDEALAMCDNALDVKEKKHKAILLISDGEDNSPLRESNVAEQLRSHGVLVITVGVGTQNGSPIMEPGNNEYKKDGAGNIVVSKLNESGLKKIAAATGGIYYAGNDPAVVNNIISQLNGMDKKMIGGFNNQVYQSLVPVLLAIAVVLLLIEIFISERRSFATKTRRH